MEDATARRARVASYRVSTSCQSLRESSVCFAPCFNSLDERVCSRSGLSAPGLLVAGRGLRLWKKPLRIPEVYVESLDLFNEHQDGAAGRSDLCAPVARQALTPTAERLQFLLIED